MKPIFIAISGGSGAGKSTLSYKLQDMYPDKIGIIHFDDYMKKREERPLFNGIINWDHPDSIDFDKLFIDLKSLSLGESICVNTKNERDNPDYRKTKERKEIIINAKPIMILEGYLSLYDNNIRDMLDYSIYLDIHHDQRIKRRTKSNDTNYVNLVLMPMHQEFVEPTKAFASLVLDVADLSADEVFQLSLEKISHLISL